MTSQSGTGVAAVGSLALAVDVGATKLAVGLVDGVGNLLTAVQAPTPLDADAEATFEVLGRLLDEAVAEAQSRRGPAPVVCGVGCGGPMEPAGETVSPLNIPAWRRFPLRNRLAEAVRLPVHIDNDAKALALAEGWRGAAVGRANFIAMVVSSGVGGGIVLDGRLLDGEHGNAGHIGHVVVEPDGHPCPCGGRGCLEGEVSGTALARITGSPAADASPVIVERTGTLVGRAVASVANLLDLQLAVVAGSVALGFGRPFFIAAQREIDLRARLEFSRGTVIRPAGLEHRGPLIGAGAVGWRGEGHDIGIR